MNAATPSNGYENRIFIEKLSKHYGDFRALDDVNLTVPLGEFLTLLGPSGSGKSTLLMTIAGLVVPSAGDVRIGSKSITTMPARQRNFGVVFQGYALFPHMTVAANLAYPLKVRGMTRQATATKVRETLELVRLGHLADRYPKQLSGGQQQRVALARALVFSPEILLLDEPLGALDKKLRRELQDELRELQRKLGRTFINVTHDQEEAMAMSSQVAIMNHGRIVQVGKPDSLYSKPRTRFVADFLGKSNFISGKISSIDDGIATINSAIGPIRHLVEDGAMPVGADVVLALRPEKIGFSGGDNVVSMTVETVVFFGQHAEISLRSASGHQLVATVTGDLMGRPFQTGEELSVGWSRTSTVSVEPD